MSLAVARDEGVFAPHQLRPLSGVSERDQLEQDRVRLEVGVIERLAHDQL